VPTPGAFSAFLWVRHTVQPGRFLWEAPTARDAADNTLVEEGGQVQLNSLDNTVRPIRNMNVAFAWRGGPLLSLHERDLVAAQMFRDRAEHQPELPENGMSVFLGILESKVDHLPDVLEGTYGRLEQLRRSVLDQTKADLQSNLVALAEVEDQSGKIRLRYSETSSRSCPTPPFS
jgi:Mg2+ and Co2+ transporter CorA